MQARVIFCNPVICTRTISIAQSGQINNVTTIVFLCPDLLLTVIQGKLPEGTNDVDRRFDITHALAHTINIITFLLIMGLSLYMCKECLLYTCYSATLLADECK